MLRRDFLWSTAAITTVGACAARGELETLHLEDPDLDGVVPASEALDHPPFDGDALAAGVPEDDALFPLALQVGAMRSTSVLVASFVADAQPVRLYVWDDTALAVEVDLVPGAGGYLKAYVTELSAAGRYRACLVRRDASGRALVRGRVSSFRTAPEDDANEPVTFAIGACTSILQAPFPAMRQTAALKPDFFVHLGDMAYNEFHITLSAYRENWLRYLKQDGYRELFAAFGTYATWDDHEFTNDYDPESMSAARQADAKQSYFEVHAVERGIGDRLWNRYRWGRTAEVFVLDCRSERRPSTRDTDDPIYLSRAQMDWLKEGLRDSPCRFRVIANSVPIANMHGLFDIAVGDRWEGYPGQRAELLDWIRDEGITGVLFVSGDFHVCFVGEVEEGGSLYEVATTSGNGSPLAASLHPPQFSYASATAKATLLRLDPAAGTVDVEFHEPHGGLAGSRRLQL